MIMADVLAVIATLLGLAVAFPAMLLMWHLILPHTIDRVQERLNLTPWRCFFLGMGVFVLYLIPTLILFNLPWAGFKAIAWMGICGLLTLSSLGGSGLAVLLGQRLQILGADSSKAQATLRGAIILQLTALFPFIGWLIFFPLTFIISLGAIMFALLHWQPAQAIKPSPTKNKESLLVGHS